MGKVSVSGYEYIAKKVAEVVRERRSVTLLEVAGMLRTSDYKVRKAWEMFGMEYPDIVLSPEGYFYVRKTRLEEAEIGRVPEYDEEQRERALLQYVEELGVDLKKVEKEITGEAKAVEEKKKEETEERKEEAGEEMTEEKMREMERRKFEENYGKIMKLLAQRGSMDVAEVAMMIGIYPDNLLRFWREKGGNELVEMKDNRFITNLHNAFSIVNRAISIVMERGFATVSDIASAIHVREKTLRDAWELLGSLITYVKLEGDVFRYVGEKK